MSVDTLRARVDAAIESGRLYMEVAHAGCELPDGTVFSVNEDDEHPLPCVVWLEADDFTDVLGAGRTFDEALAAACAVVSGWDPPGRRAP